MKQLEKLKLDRGGVFMLKEVRREGNIAMYRQTHIGLNKVFGYDVFLVKELFAGESLPGGTVEKEDRECYPGPSSYGLTAFSCKTRERADIRFQQLQEKAKNKELLEEALGPGESLRKGKKKIDTSNIQFPDGQFTLKDVCLLNPGLTYGIINLRIKSGLARKVGEVKIGRGKPTNLYIKN